MQGGLHLKSPIQRLNSLTKLSLTTLDHQCHNILHINALFIYNSTDIGGEHPDATEMSIFSPQMQKDPTVLGQAMAETKRRPGM